MKALLSGQTGVAVCIEDEELHSINVSSPDSWTARNEWELPYIFADAPDIIELDNISRLEVLEELHFEWAKDRSLQLILILLDIGEEAQTRFEAAECLDSLLKRDEVKEYVENHLYSSPLPSRADLSSAIKLSTDLVLANLEEFLIRLQGNQDEISKRFNAWNALPASMFDNLATKKLFYYDAVRYGAFRLFVTERKKKNLAVIQLLAHPHFRGSSKARKIFQAWAASFKESVTNIEFEDQEIEDGSYKQDDIKKKKRKGGHGAYQQAEKQKEAIKNLLREGKQAAAMGFTEDLIVSQRRHSEPKHLAKSLCDLAQYAKNLGSPELQLEFALKAITELQDDAWSHATVGDAYRALGEYQKAQDHYHTAGVLGDVRIALVGRAEIMKEIGQLPEALDIYKECIRQFPDDIVSRNGLAAVLAHFGKFKEALESYDKILLEAPYDQITSCGRAEVLRDMGKLNDAFKEYSSITELYPEVMIPQHARGEVLRELGELKKAEEIFDDLVKHFPLAVETCTSHAKLLRDLGNFPAALNEFNTITKNFPLHPAGFVGIAETCRKIGNLDEALRNYEIATKRFPRFSYARNGRAYVLVAMGDYQEALRVLPDNLPATQGEWVAYHIRGMAEMRCGRLSRAEEIFEWGEKEIPWGAQRGYFKTALASVRIQQKRYPEVFPLVQGIINPSIEPVTRLLIMHAAGELGDKPQFDQSYDYIKNTSAPIVLEIRDALANRYRQITTKTQSDTWLYLHECDSLLLAA
jgi:tetratricopeptide (TPR) repeat protein